MVIGRLSERAERNDGAVVKTAVGEIQKTRWKRLLQTDVVKLWKSGKNVAEPAGMRDHKADFKLLNRHKNTTRPHLTTQQGWGQAEGGVIMIAVFGKRGPDGRFLPGETFEFKCPGEENGEPVIDAFARWAAERYRREQEQKEETNG